MNTDVILRPDLEDLCRYRDEAVQKYEEGMRLLAEAVELHRKAAIGEQIQGAPSPLSTYFGSERSQEFRKEMEKRLAQDMWRALLYSTALWSVMDKEERGRFEHEINTNPQPVTVELLKATLERLAAESGTIFRRGLVRAFQELNREYKSHDGFRIGERLVLGYGVLWDKPFGNFSHNYHIDDKLRDVDRVMHVLDGRKEPDYQQGLCPALRTAVHSWRETQKTTFDTDYWFVRFFKNGNLHLYPKREDLVARANKLLAEHFGEALGDKNPNKKSRGEGRRPRHADDMGYFPTPRPVIMQMLRLATYRGLPDTVTMLEPSAGCGNIALVAVECGWTVDCIEIQQRLVDQLLRHQKFRSVTQADFLDRPAAPVYDLIMQNPPFHDRADLTHIRHALKFLKRGGVLVSVIAGGHGPEAHQKLVDLSTERGWVWQALPEGSFEESGTSVNASLIRLEKP